MAILILIISLLPMFFYKLGSSSLVNWDEAWYAEIAKQLLISGNLLVMKFNQQIFTDHPPGGFWLITIGQQVFGINEFGSRIMSAVFGILGILGIYLLGKELFGKVVGFCSALALATAPWYLFRSRSGDLDIFLTVFMIWTVYFSVKKYFWRTTISLSWLFLIKTAAPFVIIPLLFILWGKKVFRLLVLPITIYLAWVSANVVASSTFFTKYLFVGLPGLGQKTSLWSNLMQIKVFVHHGIGNWFRYSVFALAISTFLIRQKRFLIPTVATACILMPMLFSDRARLWHMIPAYPFLLLALFGVIRKAGVIITLLFTLFIATPMLQRNRYEIVDITTYVSDEAILSQKASLLKERLYIGENFVPTAAFYSNKQIERMYGTIDELFAHADANFLLIADREKFKNTNLRYEFIARDRDKLLVRFKKF
ncbi:glycosyltransferase family 39 protein [Candidatus Amesbacteria bacterium]|nr:glycosyltransferase family 39 protein [Candidatus Amesbacteria bacterium]